MWGLTESVFELQVQVTVCRVIILCLFAWNSRLGKGLLCKDSPQVPDPRCFVARGVKKGKLSLQWADAEPFQFAVDHQHLGAHHQAALQLCWLLWVFCRIMPAVFLGSLVVAVPCWGAALQGEFSLDVRKTTSFRNPEKASELFQHGKCLILVHDCWSGCLGIFQLSVLHFLA